MTLVRTYDVPNSFYAGSTWIDTSSFFLYSSGAAWRGTVPDAGLDETAVAWSTPALAVAFPNGHGAVAFWSGNINGPSCADCARYRIWAGGSLGNEHEGWPEAWSPDGTRLAVIHPLLGTELRTNVRAAGYNGENGWLEVLSYPELQPVYSNRDIDVASVDMAFSPSGRYLLVEGSANYQVLDLDTQKLTDSPANWPVHWYGDDELATRDGRDLVAYSVDGTEVQRWKDAGDGPIGASPDGRLLVTTDHLRTPKNITVIRDDKMSTFQLPSLVGLIHTDLIEPTPANDGRSTVLLTETPAMFGPLLLLQIPN